MLKLIISFLQMKVYRCWITETHSDRWSPPFLLLPSWLSLWELVAGQCSRPLYSCLAAALTPGSPLPPCSSLIAADTNRKRAAGKMGHLDATVDARVLA